TIYELKRRPTLLQFPNSIYLARFLSWSPLLPTRPGVPMTDQPMRILLVEDDQDDADLLAMLFAEAGGKACLHQRVGRLSEGLALLAKGGVDVVLLDLFLPDSQGLETFLRAKAQAPGVPMVLLSALINEPLAAEAVREGAQDYLV